MTKRKALNLEKVVRPAGGPGKSGRYTYEIWADNEKIDEGRTTGGRAMADQEVREALNGQQE